MIDQTDKEILELLEENSRIKVKEIAKEVHLSAPTVSQRLIKLEEEVIRQYSIKVDQTKIGYPIHSFILTTMISPNHTSYLSFIERNKIHVLNHYRTSGISCYMVEVRFENNERFNQFLEELDSHANYSVLSVINQF